MPCLPNPVYLKFLPHPDTVDLDEEILRQSEREKHEKKILDWISPLPYKDRHYVIKELRAPGTGEWLLNCRQFREWCTTDIDVLFCQGIQESGKSVLA